jgi:DNA-binding response OmpR family regulator
MSSRRGTFRVAVIDREPALLKVLGKRFDAAGWEHRVLPGGAPVDELVAMRLNAIVVDLAVLGPEEGWQFLERVAGMLPGLGVIVCTSNSTVAQRVRGLRLGADDWIAKPCHPEEVMARIEAVVRRRRRARPESEQGPVILGELEVRTDQFQVYVAGRTLDLTRREFELLNTLAEAAGKVLEREEIYRRVWGYEMAHGDRSVDVFVRKLRSKIEKQSPGWDYIHTHFGIGYRFEPEGIEQEARPEPEPAADVPASVEAEPRAEQPA